MASLNEIWTGLGNRARIGIAAGASLIIVLTIGLGIWAYHADYQVLFADVPARDAAAMTAELDRMKVPYQLADGGNTILVPKDLVYKTRLKLMGKDIPLHGAVGFEVFNNADFGMTEFVQKVNYQRAIQGELTRTILSIEDIQSARVHLAIPEQGLFKKAAAKPKASVTITMKPGKVLAPEQIGGVQRLVAASVPDIAAADVTIVDQHGVALTRVASSEPGVESANSQLDSKRSTEEYLLRKVTQVLDRTFGPGEAIASVDVVLNLDQSRVTTEEVLPAKGGPQEGSPAGVVVRERQTIRESGVQATQVSTGRGGQEGSVTSIESDYQVGRRVEQVVTAAGSVRRMTVAVVVKTPLSDAQMENLKEVIGLAVGFNSQRGDAVVVHTLSRFGNANASMANKSPETVMTESESQVEDGMAGDTSSTFSLSESVTLIIALLLLVVVAVASGYALRNRREVSRKRQSDREQVLVEVRQWIYGPQKTEEIR
ncbi:MAG TPA: flagellar basal-body MS-ring/collar protein FliF [Noviherbaspirillum sp.]|nr:flagellar basal-body MS-ring/collar protein FliF [Noviherbaspirillum sp.]